MNTRRRIYVTCFIDKAIYGLGSKVNAVNPWYSMQDLTGRRLETSSTFFKESMSILKLTSDGFSVELVWLQLFH